MISVRMPREDNSMHAMLLVTQILVSVLNTVQGQTTVAVPVTTVAVPVTTGGAVTVAAMGPKISNLASTVFILQESQSSNQDLATFQCDSPNGKDPTRVDVEPKLADTIPCSKCFDVFPCNPTDWCLRYTPSMGSLDLANTPVYDLDLVCTDADGEKVTQKIQIRLNRDTVPPTFTVGASVTLLDSETQVKELTKITCTDADAGQTTKMSITSVIPKTADCSKCFALNTCGTDWCLNYIPVGGLDYAKTPSYTVTLKCTDSLGLSLEKDTEIKIAINTPPEFDPPVNKAKDTISNAIKTKDGEEVFQVKAIDANPDDVLQYRLETEADKDDFEIELTTGRILAKKDLSSACYASTTLKAFVTDGVNPEIGPLYIELELDDANVAPSLSTVNIVEAVPEDTAVNGFVQKIEATDDGKPKALTYTMTAVPLDGLNFFTINQRTGEIRLAQGLDFENTLIPRRFKFQIQASDGSCISDTATLTLDIVDVNEKPTVSPSVVSETVNEGSIAIDPTKWSVTDQDIRDSHKYEIIAGNNAGHFIIDESTGRITSHGEYDVDPNENQRETLTIRVTDKGDLTENFKVDLTILDINDNPPIINTPTDTTFTVTECTTPGTTLGTPLTATDKDSPFRGNNQWSIEPATSGPLAVNANGQVVLASKMAAGQTASIQVYAKDQGQVPNPLTSNAVHISVTSKVCPTTRPRTKPSPRPVAKRPRPRPKPRPTGASTAAPGAIDTTSGDNWFEENLPWLILAALLGTILLGLALMCLRHIIPWCQRRRVCESRPRSRRVTPVKEKKVKPISRPPDIRQLTPVEKPEAKPLSIRTPSPPPPSVVGPQDGELGSFWKEHYNEADLHNVPPRHTKPKPPVDAVNPLDHELGFAKAPGNATNVAAGVKKPTGCVIQ